MHAWLLCAATTFLLTRGVTSKPPNIVFILADDLGYNEMNWMNSTRGIHTPNLDALAHEGVVLKNYYVGAICSPTRSMLMTGRYTTRLGTQSSVIYWDTPWGIPINETFVAENFQSAGYATALFGKWHLGMFQQRYTPAHRGFTEHEGYYQGCESAYTHVAACCKAGSATNDSDYVCPVHSKYGNFLGYDWFATGPDPKPSANSEPVISANHTNSVDRIRDAAVNFIGRKVNGSQPFYLYLPFQNIHGPYTTQQRFFDLYADRHRFTEGEATIFGYISELDDAIGSIITKLKSTHAYDDTIVVFSSDNGAPPTTGDFKDQVDHKQKHPGGGTGYIARNAPHRGWKTQIWEGGVRVPGFVSGGSSLLPSAARGTVNEKLFHVTDWLPTLTTLGGINLTHAPNLPLDGLDIWPALTVTSTPSPRTEMLYNVNPLCHSGQAGAPKAAIRVGNLKLIAWCFNVSGINGSTTTGPIPAPNAKVASQSDPAFAVGDGLVLYDLEADPNESTNLRSQPRYESEVKSMLERLTQLAEEMVEPQQWEAPYQGPGYFCANCPKHPRGKDVNGPAIPWVPWL